MGHLLSVRKWKMYSISTKDIEVDFARCAHLIFIRLRKTGSLCNILTDSFALLLTVICWSLVFITVIFSRSEKKNLEHEKTHSPHNVLVYFLIEIKYFALGVFKFYRSCQRPGEDSRCGDILNPGPRTGSTQPVLSLWHTTFFKGHYGSIGRPTVIAPFFDWLLNPRCICFGNKGNR
jgi:hypothetical protein